MKKKTAVIFMSIMMIMVIGFTFTGCGNKDKDMTDNKTQEEKVGDSSSLNEGVVDEDGEMIGDATDAGKAEDKSGKDNNGKSLGEDMKDGAKDIGNDIKDGAKDVTDDMKDGINDMTDKKN